MGRTIAIGDIHGCSKALRSLLEIIQPESDDTLVFLGDYIDRGPDSRGVVDQVVELSGTCDVVPLRGNHELMLMAVRQRSFPQEHWLACGGQATISSYGGDIQRMPSRHMDFFQRLRPFHETDSAIFVHAGYEPEIPMERHDDHVMYWNHLNGVPPEPHFSGKTVFVGHTPQGSGAPLDLGHLVCLDTYCFGGLWLTAMDVDSREFWQASYHGHLRRRPFQWMVDAWRRRKQRRRQSSSRTVR